MRLVAAGRPAIHIVTPALAAANNGNAHTAARWQRFLAPVADCSLAQTWGGAPVDALVALHARRSAGAVAAFRAAYPQRPIVLVLTGTDLYGDLGDATVRHSLECASAIVVLQPEGLTRLPDSLRARATVIVQSAVATRRAAGPSRNSGEVRAICDPLAASANEAPDRATRDPLAAEFIAIGHLRAEKDPLTLMRAARLLGDPGIRIAHVGAALDAALGRAAEATMAACPGYRWLGARPHAETRHLLAQAGALVHTSLLEGGANVIIEAVRSKVPVLASRIDGNVGLLGRDYAGYFEAGDAAALAALMRRFAGDAAFADALTRQCAKRAPDFAPARERSAVRGLLKRLLDAASAH